MVNMENYEEYMLLYADRELTPEQEKALLDFVAAHPELKQELEAYAATRLQPEESMVFTGKDALIKTEPGGKTMWLGGWKAYAAAASVILFIVLFSINRHSTKETQPVVVKDQTITEPVTTPPPVINEERTKTEELHSNQPVNTVAVKTTTPGVKKQAVQQQVVERKEAPIAPVAEHENIAVESAVKDTAEYIAEVTTPQKKAITEARETTTVTPQPVDKKNNFIATVLGEKPAGLEKLEEEVNEKLAAAKTIREQIKNTDAEVSFRIGKKELFTVRL